jgi:hypothetical protein
MSNLNDAKAMAKSLRDSIASRNFKLSHSECLEIVARQLGFADWNTACAKLERTSAHEHECCSFCDKSRLEVRGLIEGGCRARNKPPSSCVFICDECVVFGAQVLADTIGTPLEFN